MPAPLAKGLILSLSLLLAAGLAVYDNPHVRQWVDETRQKIAVALHSLGDEMEPPHRRSSPGRSFDASAHEDESPEAVARRRRAREEILERGRYWEGKRRAAPAPAPRRSFDDLVDDDGNLRAGTTATADPPHRDAGLRRRNATEADPFADGSQAESPDEKTAPPRPQGPPAPVAASTGPSSDPLLVDLAAAAAPAPQTDYFSSINEWAEASTGSFYSPAESAAATSASASDIGEAEYVDGADVDADVLSEAGVSTPGTWTEVGSVVSDE